jgi:glycosyltransferase involved in cell wall biosynthesis
MRIAFALPGLHRTDRGAEIAFISVGSELARSGHRVTLIGSGPDRPSAPYRYHRAPLIPRERFERFPRVPALRGETAWEEASFMPGFLRVYRPQDYDVTVTCSYPFLNWALRSRKHRGRRPAHVFVTQNGDWPARADNSEYRFFGCEGLVCINPDFLVANQDRYHTALIPNGVDLSRFSPGPPVPNAFDLPEGVPIVLMVSALIESKMVGRGVEAVSRIPGAHLVVAGDGPLREQLRARAADMMPGRYHNLTITPDRMPALYRSATAFLHLSRDESFGNVYVEAMACGIPMVAWDLPRTRWITGDIARLVPDEDDGALVAVLRESLAAGHDIPALTARAQNFAWQVIAGRYADFFREVAGQTSAAERNNHA